MAIEQSSCCSLKDYSANLHLTENKQNFWDKWNVISCLLFLQLNNSIQKSIHEYILKVFVFVFEYFPFSEYSYSYSYSYNLAVFVFVFKYFCPVFDPSLQQGGLSELHLWVASLSAIMKNYGTLMKLWGWAQHNISKSDMKTRIIGVQTKMQTFHFFYGIQLAL